MIGGNFVEVLKNFNQLFLKLKLNGFSAFMDLGGLHKVSLISAYYHCLGLATKGGISSSSRWICDPLAYRSRFFNIMCADPSLAVAFASTREVLKNLKTILY